MREPDRSDPPEASSALSAEAEPTPSSGPSGVGEWIVTILLFPFVVVFYVLRPLLPLAAAFFWHIVTVVAGFLLFFFALKSGWIDLWDLLG